MHSLLESAGGSCRAIKRAESAESALRALVYACLCRLFGDLNFVTSDMCASGYCCYEPDRRIASARCWAYVMCKCTWAWGKGPKVLGASDLLLLPHFAWGHFCGVAHFPPGIKVCPLCLGQHRFCPTLPGTSGRARYGGSRSDVSSRWQRSFHRPTTARAERSAEGAPGSKLRFRLSLEM